eukprot:TRINITY_DN13680_c0_g1_i1.p2 TRINITY_DN13680_c0_g1~~TRINITY_DN13680_c0_g1_i1.p2  ORF type:complete len:197 (+),score=55.47 TRINITY_DN13680_c0_g1_i1:23-592(+)
MEEEGVEKAKTFERRVRLRLPGEVPRSKRQKLAKTRAEEEGEESNQEDKDAKLARVFVSLESVRKRRMLRHLHVRAQRILATEARSSVIERDNKAAYLASEPSQQKEQEGGGEELPFSLLSRDVPRRGSEVTEPGPKRGVLLRDFTPDLLEFDERVLSAVSSLEHILGTPRRSPLLPLATCFAQMPKGL